MKAKLNYAFMQQWWIFIYSSLHKAHAFNCDPTHCIGKKIDPPDYPQFLATRSHCRSSSHLTSALFKPTPHDRDPISRRCCHTKERKTAPHTDHYKKSITIQRERNDNAVQKPRSVTACPKDSRTACSDDKLYHRDLIPKCRARNRYYFAHQQHWTRGHCVSFSSLHYSLFCYAFLLFFGRLFCCI